MNEALHKQVQVLLLLFKGDSTSCKLTSMANSPGISSIRAVAKELVRILTTHAVVFARIWIATIDHLTSVENDFVLAAVLFVLFPIGWKFVVPVNADDPHAPHETLVMPCPNDASANQVNVPSRHLQNSFGLHRSTVDIEDQAVLCQGQDHLMPFAVIEHLIKVVQNGLGLVLGLQFDLQFSFVQEHLEEHMYDYPFSCTSSDMGRMKIN